MTVHLIRIDNRYITTCCNKSTNMLPKEDYVTFKSAEVDCEMMEHIDPCELARRLAAKEEVLPRIENVFGKHQIHTTSTVYTGDWKLSDE